MEGRELLEGDAAAELRLPREVDDGHPAAADLTYDLVPPDPLRGPHAHTETVVQGVYGREPAGLEL
jgi:hypothetical protein